jgi:hypothetical protein
LCLSVEGIEYFLNVVLASSANGSGIDGFAYFVYRFEVLVADGILYLSSRNPVAIADNFVSVTHCSLLVNSFGFLLVNTKQSPIAFLLQHGKVGKCFARQMRVAKLFQANQ